MCNRVYLKLTTFCVYLVCSGKTIRMAALNIPDTQMYSQLRMSLSPLGTAKPACEGTNKGDFLHLQRGSESAEHKSQTVKSPSAASAVNLNPDDNP